MPRPFHSLVISALLTVVYSDCTSDLLKCKALAANYITGLSLLQWDKDIIELNERCGTGKFYFDCMNTFRKTCNIPNILNDTLPEQKKFRDRLCIEDCDLKKKYLKGGQCLEEISSGINAACGIQAAPQQNADISSEDAKKVACRGYRALPCLKGKIEESCGKDARLIFEEGMNPELPILKELCGGAYGLASFNWVLAAALLTLASFYST